MSRSSKSKVRRSRASEAVLLDARDANLKRKYLTCLRCGRTMRTDRCHRICRSCRRHNRSEIPGRAVTVTLTSREELVEVPHTGAEMSTETLELLESFAEFVDQNSEEGDSEG